MLYMSKNNTTLPILICVVVGIAAIVGMLKSTSWVTFWIALAVLAIALILLVVLSVRPRRVRRSDYEQRVSDRLSKREK